MTECSKDIQNAEYLLNLIPIPDPLSDEARLEYTLLNIPSCSDGIQKNISYLLSIDSELQLYWSELTEHQWSKMTEHQWSEMLVDYQQITIILPQLPRVDCNAVNTEQTIEYLLHITPEFDPLSEEIRSYEFPSQNHLGKTEPTIEGLLSIIPKPDPLPDIILEKVVIKRNQNPASKINKKIKQLITP